MMLPIDPVWADEAFHYVVVPASLWFVNRFRAIRQEEARARENAQMKKLEEFATKSAAEAAATVLNSRISNDIAPIIEQFFNARKPQLKEMIDKSNDELLQKINGTYVRSREAKIQNEAFHGRLDGIERRLEKAIEE